MRPLGQTRLVVCASPEYWAREGIPQEPEALRDHHCLIGRSSGGTLLDRWIFEKNGERRTIDVRTRVFSDDRIWLDAAACAGAGVVRLTDVSLIRYLSSALLVPVLTDWECLEAPTIFAAYPPAQRRSRLVRVFSTSWSRSSRNSSVNERPTGKRDVARAETRLVRPHFRAARSAYDTPERGENRRLAVRATGRGRVDAPMGAC